MKRICALCMVLLIVISVTIVGYSQEAQAASAYNIKFTYTDVINKDYDISNYSVSSSSNHYLISLDNKLADYLLTNNKTIKISFSNDNVISIPAAAFNTTEYQALKKAGDAFSIKIDLVLTKSGSIYDYFSENTMNSKGFYVDPKLSFEIDSYFVCQGDETDITAFAAPISMTQPYSWGTDCYMPASQNESLLRYYLIDTESEDLYGNYDWSIVTSTVDKNKDTLTGKITKTGLYCALSSKSHTGSSTTTGTAVASKTGFSDMAGHWAENDVLYLQAQNVILSSSGSFLPNQNVTRAEFAVYITRMLSLPASTSAEGKFTDVNKNAYYYDAVILAASNGLISGKTATTFAPQAAITRQEMAALMKNALQNLNLVPADYSGALSGFTDQATISSWARTSCAAVVKAGLITGKSGSKFAPQDTTTRAEAAVILARLCRYIHS